MIDADPTAAERAKTLTSITRAWSAPIQRAPEQWRALQEALLRHTTPPCTSNPDRWATDDQDEAQAAAWGCCRCPARQECAAYAIAADERAGVWGGMARRGGRWVDLTADDQEAS